MNRGVLRRVLVGSVTALLLAGCTSNGQTATGGNFSFVSPGGKLVFSYPSDERQTIGDLTGSSVADANTTIALSNYPDQALVLNVWGSWCGPCQGEADDLNVAAELSADRPVQFIGINVQDTRPAAMDFIREKAVPFPSIFDPDSRTLLSMRGFPTSTIPSTIILDQQHRVAFIYLRDVTAQEIDEALISLVGDTAATPSATATTS